VTKKVFLEWNARIWLLQSFERLLTDYYKLKKGCVNKPNEIKEKY